MRGRHWPLIVGVVFLAGLLMHQMPLLLVAMLLLLVWGTTRLWERYCLTRIEYRRRLSQRRVFFGEEVELEFEVANRKPLPLPWLEIDDEVPEGIDYGRGKLSPSSLPARLLLTNIYSLGWYHRIRRRYRLQCNQRGSFTFGPARLRSGDLFGFSRQEMNIPDIDRLTVYPRILPVSAYGIPSKQPLGEIMVKRYLFEDPILTMGVREYHYGDSLKRIDWKATARSGQLQTKVFEPTTSIDLGIFLDVRTVVAPYQGTISHLQELGIIAAASIAKQAMADGYRVGLYANQARQDSNQRIRLAPSQHAEQMVRILEALAQIRSSIEIVPAARFVTAESRNLPWGSTILMIAAVPSEALLASLLSIKRAGRSVALLQVGGDAAPSGRRGLTTYRIADDVDWREMESVSLTRLAS